MKTVGFIPIEKMQFKPEDTFSDEEDAKRECQRRTRVFGFGYSYGPNPNNSKEFIVMHLGEFLFQASEKN